jgi:ferric-dicitrate binding protein FerR (iron transport regulator)
MCWPLPGIIAHAASDLPRILQTLENALPVRVTTTADGWRIAAR